MSSGSEPTRIERAPWFAQGLRFECTQCGNCCTGPPGYVWITVEEGHAMAAELGIDIAEFQSKYARRALGRWTLRENETEHGHDCIFLDRDTHSGRAICGMYNARPSQCRSWPFWPENVRSEQAWTRTKRVTPCPGMDQGKLVSADDIRIIRSSSTEK